MQAGDEGSGETVFETPIRTTYLDRGSLYLDEQCFSKIQPEDGKLVLFPSYLSHYQSMYKGNKDRIVVAFNSSINEFRED